MKLHARGRNDGLEEDTLEERGTKYWLNWYINLGIIALKYFLVSKYRMFAKPLPSFLPLTN